MQGDELFIVLIEGLFIGFNWQSGAIKLNRQMRKVPDVIVLMPSNDVVFHQIDFHLWKSLFSIFHQVYKSYNVREPSSTC